MNSLILSTSSYFLLPLFLLFSIFILFRGLNEPGGGFVGGLVMATAVIVQYMAGGTRWVEARHEDDAAKERWTK